MSINTPNKQTSHLKREILVRLIRAYLGDSYEEDVRLIPYKMRPQGSEVPYRCCIHKERAILRDRVIAGLGFDIEEAKDYELLSDIANKATKREKPEQHPLTLLQTACNECVPARIHVTDLCQGCVARPCESACKFGAIKVVDGKSRIDQSKCKSCGLCAQVCPFQAITKIIVPCENACPVGAIAKDEDGLTKIDHEKCISCGACVYQCPFGAIMDKSYILNVIDLIRKSRQGRDYRLYAVVAPSISSQFTYAKLGQVITGLKELGFHTVVEAALGADMVAKAESAELAEKGFLTSSCCPAFVSYVRKEFPQLAEHISHNLSPMATIAKFIKETTPQAKVVFIGPCTAKKAEVQLENVKPYVDAVITFEELQALFDSRDIDLTTLPEGVLDDASYYGRIFARSGGLSDAVAEGLKEQDLENFELKACACDGIEECRTALLKKNKNMLDANFIEGMACQGGCIGGAGCLTHGVKSKAQVDAYGKEAYEKSILEAVSVLDLLRKE